MITASSLRYALLSNALFSLGSALLLLFFPAAVGQWLGLEGALVYRAIGVGLILFALDLVHQATRPRIATWRALYASAGDFSWVIGTLALMVLASDLFSSRGTLFVAGIAAAVLSFGVWQILAIAQVHRVPNVARRGEYRHCIIVEVNASANAMWQVISDLGDIKKYMPSLKSSVVVSDREPGVGTVRTCEDQSGRRWSEECTEFNVGRNFTVRFFSEDPDFPFPAKTMRGGWEITPSEVGSQVMVWWELMPKQKLLAPVLLPLLAWHADRDFPRVIQRMAAAAVAGAVPASSGASLAASGIIARLLPDLC